MHRRALFILIAALLVAPTLIGTEPQAKALDLPAGFSSVEVPTGQGEFNLTDFAFLPAGGMLTIGKNGRITHVDPSGAIFVLGQVATATEGDLGLTSIALAPDYAQTGNVYAAYAFPTGPNQWGARLARWTFDNPASPRRLVTETTVLSGIEHTSPHHTVGTVVADDDGTIWLTVGDGSASYSGNQHSLRAQNINVPYGKLLRFYPNGAGVPSNPFYDPAAPQSWKSRVWAYGFRNPFRFTLHPDGTPYIGDVGWNTREEINLGRSGGNFGWPCYEGTFKPAAFQSAPECTTLNTSGTAVPPFWEYARNPEFGASVIGGVFAWGDAYPEPYANSYFFGELIEAKLWTLETDDQHTMTRPPEAQADRASGAWARNAGQVVSFHQGPNGEIHYANLHRGTVVHLRYTPGNRPPTAVASSNQTFGQPSVAFFGGQSGDPDGDPLTYEWNFGDGATSTERDPVHEYPSASRFTATLTVRDNKGAAASTTEKVILDDHKPVLTVQGPSEDKRYAVDEPIAATAVATDAEDVGLGPQSIQWRADVIHCTSAISCHTHPGRVSSGPEFSMPFPDHGPDVSVKVTAWVEDSVGHVETRTFDAKPRLQSLTLVSEAGSPLYVNNEQVASGATVPVVANAKVELRASDGLNQVFLRWDGDQPSAESRRTYVMPPTDSTVTAKYRPLSLNVSHSKSEGGPSFYAHVSIADGLATDAVATIGGVGCLPGPVVSGDNGDGQLAVGETWKVACYFAPPVELPEHPVQINATTANGGMVTGTKTVPTGGGYRMVATDGGIFSFGEGPFAGSTGHMTLNQPIVGMAATPSGLGYWMVARDGGIFAFGDAQFFGSMGGQPITAPIIGMAPTATGQGYWLAGSDGNVYAFGDAPNVGSLLGVPLNQPVVGIAAAPTNNGYWLIASDGGMFSFGSALFYGSMGGQRLNQPIVGMAPTASGRGYWQVASDGGMFSFGDAQFFGSMGGTPLNQPVTGMSPTPSRRGYWLVATDGGIFAFGDAQFYGSMGGTKLNKPVVGMTPTVIAKL